MPPSPSPVLIHVPRDVFTTTVFAGGAPTTAVPPSASQSHASLPIPAIVGGLLGGICLALAAVGGWIWWGKSLEKQSRKNRPRIRSAMKRNGRGPPSVNASKHSLPRNRPANNPMATISQKSVTFAPSPRTSEDSDSPKTPSPTASEPEARGEGKGKQTARATHEAGPARTPPPRSSLRPPSKRVQSADRAYAPSRPSPLAHTSHPAPPTPPLNLWPTNQAETQWPAIPPPPPPPPRQLTTVSVVDRSSGVSAPSEYSQEGTASEGGSEVAALRMAHALDGRLHPHQEVKQPQPSTSRSHQRGPPNYSTRIR